MSVLRVVPDLASRSLERTTRFYRQVLGLDPVMDHGWIVTVADPDQPGCQVSLMTHDATASVIPDVSIQVDDVDAVYAAALEAEAEIVHPLTDEPWEVRRFFVRDPDGHVLNVLSHKPADSVTSRDVGTLNGGQVRLRPAARDDIPALAAIRRTPEVHARWRGGEDLIAAVTEDFDEPDSTPYVIELAGQVVGWIQWSAEEEPDYRYATIDIYLDPAVHGRGLGTDAVRTLARHLINDHGHHRLEIDPAADNEAAIRCYSKVGFQPVGIRRRSERGGDGTWHDGMLMDLLADELTDDQNNKPLSG